MQSQTVRKQMTGARILRKRRRIYNLTVRSRLRRRQCRAPGLKFMTIWILPLFLSCLHAEAHNFPSACRGMLYDFWPQNSHSLTEMQTRPKLVTFWAPFYRRCTESCQSELQVQTVVTMPPRYVKTRKHLPTSLVEPN